MDATTQSSPYESALEAYDASLNKINFWRKRSTLILISGIASIVLTIVAKALFYPIQKYQYTQGVDLFTRTHSGWVNLEISCFCAIGAIICGWLGRGKPAFNSFPTTPEISSQQDYDLTLKDVGEEIGENDELANQQKRFAAYSVGLFLTTDLLLLFL